MKRFRLFYLTPDGDQSRAPDMRHFAAADFDAAYKDAVQWIRDNQPEGTRILLLAQLDR